MITALIITCIGSLLGMIHKAVKDKEFDLLFFLIFCYSFAAVVIYYVYY